MLNQRHWLRPLGFLVGEKESAKQSSLIAQQRRGRGSGPPPRGVCWHASNRGRNQSAPLKSRRGEISRQIVPRSVTVRSCHSPECRALSWLRRSPGGTWIRLLPGHRNLLPASIRTIRLRIRSWRIFIVRFSRIAAHRLLRPSRTRCCNRYATGREPIMVSENFVTMQLMI